MTRRRTDRVVYAAEAVYSWSLRTAIALGVVIWAASAVLAALR